MELRFTTLSISLIMSLVNVSAHAVPDSNEAQITLKKTCPATEANCFDNPGLMLDWIWETRKPTANTPLIVNIAPGTWEMPNNKYFCPSGNPTNGNVAFRGSGRGNTILTGGGLPLASGPSNKPVLGFDNCHDIAIQDLTIQSDYRRGVTGSIEGIYWSGPAGSTWSNVEVQANRYGWVDADCGTGPTDTHYWFGSKVEARTGPVANTSAFGFYPFCAVTNFYGGQIVGLHDKPYGSNGVAAVAVNGLGINTAIFSAYGSSVHASNTSDSGPVGFWSITGLLAYNTGEVHMHGGSITVESNNDTLNQKVIGVWAIQQAKGHAIDTAFIVKPSGTEQAYRILNAVPGDDTQDGVVDAPFLWPAGTHPPSPGDPTGTKHIISTNGNDIFVETDCATTGCQAVGTETHLLIYNDNCMVDGPWFDVVTRKCRGE